MRFLLARIMTPPPPQSHPVKKSTGRFGALQVRKVPGKVLPAYIRTAKKTGKDFGKVYSVGCLGCLAVVGALNPLAHLVGVNPGEQFDLFKRLSWQYTSLQSLLLHLLYDPISFPEPAILGKERT